MWLLLTGKMVLRMKNFNILKGHWKIRLLRAVGSRKINIEGGDCLKREALTVCWFKGGLGKKEAGEMFLGGLRPQYILWVKTDTTVNVSYECSNNFWNYWESVCVGITSY